MHGLAYLCVAISFPLDVLQVEDRGCDAKLSINVKVMPEFPDYLSTRNIEWRIEGFKISPRLQYHVKGVRDCRFLLMQQIQ